MDDKMGNMEWWDVWGTVADGDLLQPSLTPLPCLPGRIQDLPHLPGVVRFPFAKACQGMWRDKGEEQALGVQRHRYRCMFWRHSRYCDGSNEQGQISRTNQLLQGAG